MTDPRTVLDTYAAGISGMGTTEQAAPEAIAALRGLLGLADAIESWEPDTADSIRRCITESLGGDQ